jgi:hypothetical protein
VADGAQPEPVALEHGVNERVDGVGCDVLAGARPCHAWSSSEFPDPRVDVTGALSRTCAPSAATSASASGASVA